MVPRPRPSCPPLRGQSRWPRSTGARTLSLSQVTRLSLWRRHPGPSRLSASDTLTTRSMPCGTPRPRHARPAPSTRGAPLAGEVTACTTEHQRPPLTRGALSAFQGRAGGRKSVRAPRPGLVACHWSICSRVHVGVRPTIVGSGIRPSARYVSTVRIERPRYSATWATVRTSLTATSRRRTRPQQRRRGPRPPTTRHGLWRERRRRAEPRPCRRRPHGHPRQRCRSRRRSRR